MIYFSFFELKFIEIKRVGEKYRSQLFGVRLNLESISLSISDSHLVKRLQQTRER